MTKAELSQAVAIAKSNADLAGVDTSHMVGYGLNSFEPVHVTLDMVASMIRYQCIMFNGDIDGNELNELADAGRRKFIVIG